MNQKLSEKEVSDHGVVSEVEEVWRNIPGMEGYQASSLGRIKGKKGVILYQSKAPTTKGYYKNVHLSVNGWSKLLGVHRLVCLAFHPLPSDADTVTYEPNHIDGDKLNNRADNLEWMTRSQNVKHAFESGLCQVGIRIKAKNIISGEELNFNSLSSAARGFKKSRQEMRLILTKHKNIPLNGEWVFEADDSSDKKLARHQAVAIQAKDYRTNEVLIFRDATAAGHHTGVQQGTISFNAVGRAANQNGNLVNGYVFRKLSDIRPFPEFSKEEVQASISKYNNKKTVVKIKVIDLQSNTTEIYPSKLDFSRSIGRPNGANFQVGKIFLGRYQISEVV